MQLVSGGFGKVTFRRDPVAGRDAVRVGHRHGVHAKVLFVGILKDQLGSAVRNMSVVLKLTLRSVDAWTRGRVDASVDAWTRGACEASYVLPSVQTATPLEKSLISS